MLESSAACVRLCSPLLPWRGQGKSKSIQRDRLFCLAVRDAYPGGHAYARARPPTPECQARQDRTCQASNEAFAFTVQSPQAETARNGDKDAELQQPRTAGGSESQSCSNQSTARNVWRPVASAASGLGATLEGEPAKNSSPSHEALDRHSTVAAHADRRDTYSTVLCSVHSTAHSRLPIHRVYSY